LEKPEVAGGQIWAVSILIDLGDAIFTPKKPAQELQNVQAHCLDEAVLLARSL
jgi:hypothetical protein